MSSLGSPSTFFLAKKKAYEVERSLRFVSDNSAYLDRTPSGDGNRKTFTISFWVKRANLSATSYLYSVGTSSTNYFHSRMHSNGTIQFNSNVGGTVFLFTTDRLFRDPASWYHIVFSLDSTQATASDRVKIYVNGQQETSFSTETYPSQNTDFLANSTSTVYFGRRGYSASEYLDGYLAEFNFLDGYAYDPSYFGKTNVLTGQWNPKKYGGSYGTNGFYLNFSDNSGTSATTLGKDESGNGNNWTPNNFSVSAGAGNDSLEDTPTNNFATMNPLVPSPSVTWANGNLDLAGTSSSEYNQNNTSTFGVTSGKWYVEVKYTNDGTTNTYVGICPISAAADENMTGSVTDAAVIRMDNTLFIEGSAPSSGTSISSGDIIGIALDMDNQKVWFSVQGTYVLSGNPSTGANATFDGITAGETIAICARPLSGTLNFNFGQRPFAYTPPTGFKALNSANLPEPTILLPNKHFDTLLYTGNDSTNAITGLNYQPDWVWLKRRNGSNSHQAFDSVRGAGKNIRPDTTAAEATTTAFNSFDSNGFELDGTSNNNNGDGNTYVAWNWNVGDTDGKTYTVTVVDDSGNKYRFDGFGTSAVTLDLAEGGTYIFNYPSAHPFKFSTTADGTHGGGSEYTTGVTHNSSTQVTIVVAASSPQLYYYCGSHSGMGGAVNTNSTLGSSNFDGSVQSLVKANPTAGISITRYTGTGSSITVGHGLGVTPQVTMTKKLTGTSNWTFLHTVYDGSYDRLYLNTSAAYANSAITPPTSTVFSRVASDVNNSGMICYSFSSVEGYSKISFYRGNGSSDGTFVYCGFRPAWIMIKGRTGTRNWFIKDIKRDPFNLAEVALLPNSNATESTSSSYDLDILSNGFKIRVNNTQSNSNNIVYIFMAYAESPFKNARAR